MTSGEARGAENTRANLLRAGRCQGYALISAPLLYERRTTTLIPNTPLLDSCRRFHIYLQSRGKRIHLPPTSKPPSRTSQPYIHPFTLINKISKLLAKTPLKSVPATKSP